MKLVLSCLLLVSVSFALASEEDDSSSDSTTCGCGKGAKNKYPFAVALATSSDIDYKYCAATIISPWHILTTARCTDRMRPGDIKAVAGAQSYDIAKIIDHEKYDLIKAKFDISLLETKTPISFTDNVGPVCLPTGLLDLVGKKVKSLGLRTSSDVVPEADQTVTTLTKCQQDWMGTTLKPQDHNLCTDRISEGPCEEVSGSPLIWLDPDTDRYTLVAQTSYAGLCGSSEASANTDVSYFVSWINSKIAASKPGVKVCTKA